jgi:hypothetical protein
VSGSALTLTTSGRPVVFGLQVDPSDAHGFVMVSNSSTDKTSLFVMFYMDGKNVAEYHQDSPPGASFAVPVSLFHHMLIAPSEIPLADEHHFEIRMKFFNGSGGISLRAAQFYAYEL